MFVFPCFVTTWFCYHMFVLPCFVYPMFVLPYVLLPYVLLPSVLVTTCFSYHILFSQLSFVTTLLLLQHVLLPLSCCYYTPFVTTGFVTTFLLLPRSFCYHTLFLSYILVTIYFCYHTILLPHDIFSFWDEFLCACTWSTGMWRQVVIHQFLKVFNFSVPHTYRNTCIT